MTGSFDIAFNFIVYLVTFLAVWWAAPKNRCGLFLTGLYAVFALNALLLFLFFDSRHEYGHLHGLLPFFGLYLLLILLGWPVIAFRDGALDALAISRSRKVLVFLWACGLVYLATMLPLLPEKFSQALTLLKTNSFDESYLERIGEVRQRSGLNFSSLWRFPAECITDLIPFFFFFSLVLKHRRLSVLFGAELPYTVVANTASAGRSGLVRFALLLAFCVLAFRRLLPPRTFRGICLGLGILVAAVAGIVGIQTFSRYGKKVSADAVESAMVYAGQPMLNYNQYVSGMELHSRGNNNFAMFRMLMGLEHPKRRSDFKNQWRPRLGIPLNVFYTAVGDWVIDFGWLPVACALAVFARLFRKLTEVRGRTATLSQLYWAYFVFVLAGPGCFYYNYKTTIGGATLLALLAVGCFWLALERSRKWEVWHA